MKILQEVEAIGTWIKSLSPKLAHDKALSLIKESLIEEKEGQTFIKDLSHIERELPIYRNSLYNIEAMLRGKENKSDLTELQVNNLLKEYSKLENSSKEIHELIVKLGKEFTKKESIWK